MAAQENLVPASRRDNETGRRKGAAQDWLLPLALAAMVLLAYQPAWNGKPVWDDEAHLTKPELRSWNGLARIWIEPGATQQYYPLVHSAFWLEQKLWGDEPLGYHLVNILLHIGSALLLVEILRRLEAPGAWLAAALWALHPVQTESVAWISELKNALSGVCYTGSALAWLRFDRERKRSCYLAALGLFVAGLLAKTVIATLPAALLLVFWWKRKQLRWKEDVLPAGPFFVAGIGLGLFTAWVERTNIIGPDAAMFHLSLVERFLVAGRAVWFYLGKLVWPHHLIFIYPRWEVSGAVGWQYLFPAGALLLAAGLWRWRRHLGNGPLVALLFFAGTLFPALGFFDVYPFRYSFVADHFQYLASLGPLALAAAGIERGLARMPNLKPPLRPLLCAVLPILLGALTWDQCGMYAGVETLWRTTLARNPACWMAENNLGHALYRHGDWAGAIEHYRKAVELKPDYEDARINLGNTLLEQGDLEGAIGQFQKAVELKPDLPELRGNLAIALSRKGDLEGAIAQCRKAVELKPDDVEARNNLGAVLLTKGDSEGAIGQFQMALKTKPDDAATRYNLGNALVAQGDPKGAIAQFQRSLEIKPGQLTVQNNLAWLLATLPDASLRNGAKARALAEQANQSSRGGNPVILRTLAAAYAEEGNYEQAAATIRRALDLAAAQHNDPLAAALRKEIQLYQANTPLRDVPR
jgi:tetratricopeptide (TPR) repeat protein